MVQNNQLQEDEIDLRELFLTIWKYKRFIIAFTLIITLGSIIYAYTKIPIYEVRSVVRIGYIGHNLLESPNIIEKKLNLIFNVDNKSNIVKENNPIVSGVKVVKKVDNFIQIFTQAYSNKEAIEKNKEVIKFLDEEYKLKIKDYILETNINIDNLKKKIDYIENVEKKNLELNIEKIKNQDIPQINEKINLIKNQDIPQINEKINLIKNQDIPQINEKIKLIKTVELKSINNKIEFNQSKLNKYENTVLKMSKYKSSSNTENMLASMQMLNTENLILSIHNTLENLNNEKENLKNIKLKELENKKENLKNIKLKELENKKINLTVININALEHEKQNLINEKLRSLNIKLNVNLKMKIDDLKDKLKIESFKLTKINLNNSEIVGNFLVNDYPKKPKRKLIVAVAFMTGLILSIFLVFFIEFIKGIIKEEKIK